MCLQGKSKKEKVKSEDKSKKANDRDKY